MLNKSVERDHSISKAKLINTFSKQFIVRSFSYRKTRNLCWETQLCEHLSAKIRRFSVYPSSDPREKKKRTVALNELKTFQDKVNKRELSVRSSRKQSGIVSRDFGSVWIFSSTAPAADRLPAQDESAAADRWRGAHPRPGPRSGLSRCTDLENSEITFFD